MNAFNDTTAQVILFWGLVVMGAFLLACGMPKGVVMCLFFTIAILASVLGYDGWSWG